MSDAAPADSPGPHPKREIDLGAMPERARYGLLTSVVVPRPIAWVSSLDADGVPNLAPHSYFMILSTDPPILGFVSVGEKDTLRNIRETGDYVINIAGEHLIEALNLSSADFPSRESEFAWAGLTPEPSRHVRAPAVAEAAVALECRLREVVPYGNTPNYLIVGDVAHLRLAEAVVRDGRVAADLLRAVGRHGGPVYSRTADLFTLERPRYADMAARRPDGDS
ncbi:MAG: Nitrilotriacetate monooxygenase component B [uncultured Thermomicrobiales bacterium]|uniref:Nitrilotriacetate monooxygenase component B n=1 Tax=uncultured Thermomicrobiales bacterium TaxID=1645740 RepID=A0A6J4U6U6_9BACT|nr:MAG: Nitrilotriacetate monooxygenase component B [uncultured Thermomicrobiales bacterium]